MWIVIGIIALLLILWLLKDNQGAMNSINNDGISMYNMDLHVKYKKMYSQAGDQYYLYASVFNEVLGYAAQGRISDINYVYKNDLEAFRYHEDFISFMIELKPDLLAMARIGDRVSKADMPLNSNFASVGDFEDYKLRKSKAFMERFNKLNAIDLKKLYNEKYQNYIGENPVSKTYNRN